MEISSEKGTNYYHYISKLYQVDVVFLGGNKWVFPFTPLSYSVFLEMIFCFATGDYYFHWTLLKHMVETWGGDITMLRAYLFA